MREGRKIFIEPDFEVRAEIDKIKNPKRQNRSKVAVAFGLLIILSYIILLYAKNEFDFTSLSALFAILGASALWWESNHSDFEIIPDFQNITDHKDLTIPGLV